VDVGQELSNTRQKLINTQMKLMTTELELEDMRKRAIRAEEEAEQLRAERAENLRGKRDFELKTKLLEKKVIDLTNQLDEERNVRRRTDKRIDNLDRRLVEYGRSEQVVEEAVVAVDTVESAVVVHLRP
ncbi:hypothetical protein PMAYCL1PPCAC_14542, partial [Pristionchus mayeri]